MGRLGPIVNPRHNQCPVVPVVPVFPESTLGSKSRII